MHRLARLLASTAVAGLVGGCAVGPNYHQPKPDVPAAFVATSPQDNAQSVTKAAATPLVDETRWWGSFHDPELTTLVERAIKNNLDLQIAISRLQEAETAEQVVLGTALPEVGASGAKAWGTGSDVVRGRVAPPLAAADDTNGSKITQAIGFDGGWQIDLFGQFRRELEASKADMQAAAEARNDVLVTVVANVARAYFDLLGLEMRFAVLSHNVDTARQSLNFVQQRYDRGITNELDLTLAQRELATLEAQVGPLSSQIGAARYAIAVLIGQYPEAVDKELAVPGMIPALPADVGAGLPLDLLKRRPDIREAEREFAASNARIGVAIGNLFPRVGVSAAVGLQGPNTPGAGTSHEIWSGGPSFAWSLLDFGTLDAEVNIADYRNKEFLLAYKRTVLRAVQQVDSSIEDYRAAESSLKSLEDALTASQRSLMLAQARYDRGLTDYLNVLDAQREEYQLEDQYAAEQEAAADSLVNLYRSLGGGWERYQALPPVRTPLPVIAAAFGRLLHPEARSDEHGGNAAGSRASALFKEQLMNAAHQQAVRLRIYVGEEKVDEDQPLYKAIVRQARQMHMAGVTVMRGTQGFGRSTKLHTADVLFSDDLPVVIEIIDLPQRIDAMVEQLDGYGDVALMTYEPVALRGGRRFEP